MATGHMLDDGAWFIIARQSRAGDQLGLYLLPAGGDTELPQVPAGGFGESAVAARAKGARVINQAGDVGVSARPERYAFVREIVHRNLFRIPLR